LLHGIVLESGTKAIRIVAKPEDGAASIPASVVVEITGTGQPHRVHYRAIVELTDRLPDPPPLKLTPLTDSRAFSMDVAELYRRWLFHGPLFQGIGRVDLVGLSGVKALLATSSRDRWIAEASLGQWLFDPLMFDCALQLVVLWAREHWDMTALPSGFQSFRRFATPPARNVLCELRFRSNTGQQMLHADIFFFDADTGRVLAIIEDMQGACTKALNRLAGGHVLAAVANQS